MTDQRLRQLERRARETGSTEDEAALLSAQVRAGDLDGERLGLAAFCGHEPARLALGRGAPGRATCLKEWLRELEWWWPDVALRGLAEASVASGHFTPISLADQVVIEQQLPHFAEQIRAGTFAADAEAAACHSVQAKELILAAFRVRARPHYVDASDPEIVMAHAEVSRRRRPGHVTYNHTDREPGCSWVHHFVHVPPDGERRWRTWSASPGWAPPASSFRRPPDRRGIFDAFVAPPWENLPGAWPAVELPMRQ